MVDIRSRLKTLLSSAKAKITSFTTKSPTTTVTVTPTKPTISSVRVTDISGGTSVTTTRTTTPTTGRTTTTRTVSRVSQPSRITGGAVGVTSQISEQRAIELAKESKLEQREVERAREARTIARQVSAPSRITGGAVEDIGMDETGIDGRGTTARFASGLGTFASGVSGRVGALGTVFQTPFIADTGGRIKGFDVRPPIQPRALERGKKRVGGVIEGTTFGLGLTSDLLEAGTLGPAFLLPTKPTAETGAELEARTQRVRGELRLAREDILPTIKVKGKTVPFIPSPLDPLIKPFGRGVTQSFTELRQFRAGSKEAKKLQKEAATQQKELEKLAPDLGGIAERQTKLAKEIEAGNLAGGFQPTELSKIETRTKELSKERETILGKLPTGVTVEPTTGEFKSKALQADVGLGSIKQLGVIEGKGARGRRVAGALGQEAVKFAGIGAGLTAVGATAAIGAKIAILPRAVQTGISFGVPTLVTVSAGFKGFQARAQATPETKTAATILGAGEPIAQIGGLIIGAKPSVSPVQFRDIDIGGSKVSGVFLKRPFATGGKGVLPVVVKATTAKVSGKLVGGKIIGAKGATTQFGFGKIPTNFVLGKGAITQFTPSGNIETAVFKAGLKGLPIQDQQFVLTNLDLAKITRGVKAPVINKKILQQSESFKQLSPAGQKAFVKFLQKESGGVLFTQKARIFGSTASSAQLKTGLGRPINDIDIRFESQSGAVKAKQLANILKQTEGASAVKVLKQGQVTITKGGKVFKIADVHGIDNIQTKLEAVENPFGFPEQGPVKVGKLNINRLSQESINKLASIGSLQPDGTIGPDAVKRVKDVGDFFVINKGLASQLTGAKGIKASALLTKGKAIAISKFGIEAFAPQQKTLLGITGGLSASAVASPSAVSAALISPALKLPVPKARAGNLKGAKDIIVGSPSPAGSNVNIIGRSPSRSPRGGIGVSPSPSPSRSFIGSLSPSPSITPSPSVSPSLSPSPSQSPFISPSTSPSPSLSPSPSPSPSLSPSPSPSPSLSPSPSPSPLSQAVPVLGIPGIPLFGLPLFKRPKVKKVKRAFPKTRFVPSLTGLVLRIEQEEEGKELSIGGLDPFKLRGRVVKKKKKKAKSKSKKKVSRKKKKKKK